MVGTTNRLWVMSPHTQLTDELFAYVKAHDYELLVGITGRWMKYSLMNVDIPSLPYNGGYFNFLRDVMHRCQDEGITLWLENEADMNDRWFDGTLHEGYSVTTPYDGPSPSYEADLGSSMDLLLAEGPYFAGFITELTADNGIKWLCDRAHAGGKKVVQEWGQMLGDTYKPLNAGYADPTHGMDWRIDPDTCGIDGLIFYDYCREMHDKAIPKIRWVREYAPDLPIGITFVLTEYDPTYGSMPFMYWVDTFDHAYWGGSAYYVPYSSQVVLAKDWLTQDAIAAGGFDSVTPQMWPSCTTPLKSICKIPEGFNLHFGGGESPVLTMEQGGVTPVYCMASLCRHDFPPDTFVNTGNELILIKDVDAASTHDITVTSSLDPLINSPYTLDLSPERGTFIGPYPLDEYGALPTITYDNTNLYVSILKVEASA